MISRRRFIRTGLLFVPTVFVARGFGGVRLSNLDPEVYLWMARVRTNGGMYTSKSIVANDTWLKTIKSTGLRSRCLRKNTYTGLDLLACQTALITDWGNALDGVQNFVSGDYSEATGLTGDGINKCISTNCNPSSGSWTTENDCALETYVRTKATIVGATIGASNGASTTTYVFPSVGGTLSYASMFDNTNQINYSDTIGTGHYCASRIASNDLQLYRNGTTRVSSSAPGGTRPNSQLFVHCYSLNSIGASFCNSALGGYGVWLGLTAAQIASIYPAEQLLQTILGRQV